MNEHDPHAALLIHGGRLKAGVDALAAYCADLDSQLVGQRAIGQAVGVLMQIRLIDQSAALEQLRQFGPTLPLAAERVLEQHASLTR